MSSASHPSLRTITLLTAQIAAADGSELLPQLLPSILTYINRRSAAQESVSSLSSMATKAQRVASDVRVRERAVAEAVERYEELQRARETIRQTPARLAQFDALNSHIIDAYRNRKIAVKDKWVQLQEKLAAALAELRKKHSELVRKRKADKKEASKLKKQSDADEKKAQEEAKQKGKAEGKAERDEKLKQEGELQLKRREAQAAAQLEMKAIAANSGRRREQAEERAKIIDELMIKALTSYNAQQEVKAADREDKREVQVELDSDKENLSPADE